MAMGYDEPPRVPTREEIDRTKGAVVLEFGASWCGHCQALAPQLAALLASFPDVRHLWIEDGPGQRLGRSFQVKLWPTLVFLRDGQILKRSVRPLPGEVREGLEAISGAGAGQGREADGSMDSS